MNAKEPTKGAITHANLEAFKSDCTWAVQTKQDTFMFEGEEVLTQWAKYVVQMLNNS